MQFIDTHNHSLPGIDDGAKDMAMALAMLRVAEENGTTDIVLTPHHLNGAFYNFAEQVKENVLLLKEAAKKNRIQVSLHAGSEVHLVPETVEHLVEHRALTYCGLGKAALVELPKSTIPTGVERILSELIYNGIVPIIAHPERNSVLRQDSAPLREWVEFGCKSQVTGQSCSGEFGEGLQRTAIYMIANSLVHIVASDAHRPIGRTPNLAEAANMIEIHFGNEVASILFNSNPGKLLRGEALDDIRLSRDISTKYHSGRKTSKKRSWWRRLGI